MFKKLLSNLPFNPSLVEKVAFYAKRLHREAYIRGIGAAFLIIAIMIQLFASVSPPQAAAASNDNDLLRGGFGSQVEAVNRCNANENGYQDILVAYNINCASLANGHIVTIHSTDANRTLFSMGRIAYGKAGEQPVVINGHTYYMRYLWSWDSNFTSTYQAIAGTTTDGKPFFVLFDCGNLVMIGQPQPPPKKVDQCPNLPGFQDSTSQCDICPNIPGTQSTGNCLPCPQSTATTDVRHCIVLKKTARNITENISNANNTTAKAGDTIEYTLYVQNTALADAKGYVIKENMADVLEYADITDLHGGTLGADKVVTWPPRDIKTKTTTTQKLTVKVKDPIPNTPRSTSNPGSFDLVMTNVFGNTINIKLPNTPVKITEQTTQSLPNTGPGASLIVGFIAATVVGYFVARTRLMAKELDIAKRDAVSAGGQ